MHSVWLQQQQITTQWWCKWTSLKTSPVFIRMMFPVPIGKQCHTVHCHDLVQGPKYINGPSSQFRNKYIFEFIGITLPQLIVYNVFWNYSATSHDKGAVEGVGGTIKWVVTQALVTRKAILKDPVSMFNAVNEKTKLYLAVMTQEYIESTLWDLGMHILWQDISALPGTMHIHQVEQIDKGKVSTCMFYSDWSCTIHSLNSVELAVIDKHQDTNVNIGDFVIVKYEGKFYLGEVLYLVPNQSATVTQ